MRLRFDDRTEEFVCDHREGEYCPRCGLNIDKAPKPAKMSQAALHIEVALLYSGQQELDAKLVEQRFAEIGPYIRPMTIQEIVEQHMAARGTLHHEEDDV